MADEWDALPDIAPTPAARVGDAWDALPDAGAAPEKPGVNPTLAANVAALSAHRGDTFFQSIRDHVEPVLNAFGQGFREGWGPERLGMKPEDVKWLSEKGIYAPAGATKYDNPFQAMNELLGETVWTAGQIVGRGLPATYRGVQSALVERGVNRDIASIPDAFMGTPHPTGIPKAFPEVPRRAAAEGAGEAPKISATEPPMVTPAELAAARETSVRELATGERPATMQDLNEARDLGVIGPERAPVTEGAPREAAARVTTPPGDVLKGPKLGEGPTGNPWQDRFDKFVGKLNTGEDVQNLIRDAAKENDGFQTARAGDVPLGHVESLAEAAGVAADTVDPRGIGRVMKNDAEVRIGMQTMLQTTENVRDAAREVKANATPESLIKLQEAMMRRDLAVEQIVGLRAEWGRTGGVFQEFLRDVKDQETLNTFLKDKGRSPKDLQDIANAIDQLDATQAARVLSDLHSKRPGVFYWTWVNGLISGLLTHSKYVAANALYATSEHGIVTPIAAMIGKAKQVFGSEVERVYFGETMAASYGMVAAVPGSIMATGKSMWEGKRAVLKSEIELHKEAVARGEKVPPIIDRAVNQLSGQGRPEVFGDNSNVWGRLTTGDVGGAAKDALGRVIGAPGDMAMGIHTFFKILGERAALEAEAYRGAVKEGLSPADGDFWRRRSEIAENPTSDMRERAIASAYKGTFMNELGPGGRAWQKFTKETPGLKWLFPFSHIPLNLIKATYEQTPLALLDSEMRASLTGKNGGVAQDRAIARMVAGSAIMAYFVHQSLNGRATGDYPHDPQERDSWKLQGKQPNSVLIGGYWVSFGKFGPAGNLANLGANIGYVIPHLTSHDDDAMTKGTWHAANAAARLVVDEVGFQSLANLFEALHDEKKGVAWAANTAGSFVPFSSALGQTASGGVPFTGGYLGDPYMREAKTFIDGIKNKIPGQRETLLPKRDWLGQPMPNPQFGNIIRQKQALTDPLSMEMDRLQIHPGLPQDRIGGVKLSRPLYDEFQTLAGAYTKTALDSLVNAPGWDELPTSARIGAIHANIKSSRQIAESMMQVKHPELIGQGMQQRIDFITGKSLTARPKKAPEAVAP